MSETRMPRGRHFVSGSAYRYLPDCPKCKYGTLQRNFDKKTRNLAGAVCIDCAATFDLAYCSTHRLFK